MEDTTYNGWKNYETWNAALWLNNDLYSIKQSYAKYNPYKRRKSAEIWADFCRQCQLTNYITPDGVAFNNPRLHLPELIRALYDR